MQEFSSISVSSYDAPALAERLTESSADGWEVVSIVSAGTNVVAFLARSTDGAAPAVADAGSTDAAAGTDDTESAVEQDRADQDSFAFTLGSSSVPEAAAAETALSGDADAAAEPAAPVEPAGWGSAPEPSAPVPTPEPEPTPTPEPEPDPVPATAAETGQETGQEIGQQATGQEVGQQEAAQAAQAAQAAGAAPAGWYADPAGRYELRYWDGGQWTEHVSRAGQQYTDPPVA